jgi:tetratricopeptide (TPR) repeat protein
MNKALVRMVMTSALLAWGAAAFAALDEVARLLDSGNYQAALQGLEGEAVSYRARLLRANALSGLGRTEEAESLYSALIAEQPQDPIPYNNLARLYAATGRLQKASELLTRAMESDPRYAVVYKNLSRVYVEMSRNSYAKALRMGEAQQGLQLTGLDHRDIPLSPVPAIASVSATDAPAATPPPLDTSAAVATLKQWAAAWSAQDVESYLAAYSSDFQPPRGMGLAQWRAERRVRLKKPGNIEVELSEFEVGQPDGQAVTVTLRQRYRSDHYQDDTRKGFVLHLQDGSWKIHAEYTIEVLG